MVKKSPKPLEDAVAEATRAGERVPGSDTGRKRRAGRSADALGSEIRRHDLLPLLVLHLIRKEPTYGNSLIESIDSLTQGVITANPNTMYPLLRSLESKEMIVGDWEHPDKRTRRFYSITAAGEGEYQRLLDETEPFLDSVINSITMIKTEVYGG